MDWIRHLLSSKYLYLALTVIVAAGALTIYALDRWIMPSYTNYFEGLTVPDVTKLPLEEAEATLELYGLRHEILDQRTHSAYPAGYIIDQAPAPRQIVKPNRKVYLTINTAEPQMVVVPNLVDMSYRNARIQLENYGLNLGTLSNESGRFRNTVLRQSIAAGDTVELGTVIDLAISDGLGSRMVQVPDLTGLRLPEASQRLREAGLRIGEVHFQPSREVLPNTVLSWFPEVEELREGEPLNLTVSERHNVQEEEESGVIIDAEEDSDESGADDTVRETLPNFNQ